MVLSWDRLLKGDRLMEDSDGNGLLCMGKSLRYDFNGDGFLSDLLIDDHRSRLRRTKLLMLKRLIICKDSWSDP